MSSGHIWEVVNSEYARLREPSMPIQNSIYIAYKARFFIFMMGVYGDGRGRVWRVLGVLGWAL